jgi:hypothetical protein
VSSLTNSVYLLRDQAEINQNRLLRQIKLAGLNHSMWLRVRGIKLSARYFGKLWRTLRCFGQPMCIGWPLVSASGVRF